MNSTSKIEFCRGAQNLQACIEDLRNVLFTKVESLERSVFQLGKEVQEVRLLQVEKKPNVVVDSSLQGFAQLQSFEEIHPFFKKTKIVSDRPDNPNNFMCFTPTTLDMFVGTKSVPPLFTIQPTRTESVGVLYEVLGNVEKRFRVDIIVEFQNEEAAGFFNGILKHGSTKVTPTEYESFVHVQNPEEFVEFLTTKFSQTMERWGKIRGSFKS